MCLSKWKDTRSDWLLDMFDDINEVVRVNHSVVVCIDDDYKMTVHIDREMCI